MLGTFPLQIITCKLNLWAHVEKLDVSFQSMRLASMNLELHAKVSEYINRYKGSCS